MFKKAVILFALVLLVPFAPLITSANSIELEREVMEQLLVATPWKNADVQIDSIDLRGYTASMGSFDFVRVTLPRPITRAGKVTISVSLYKDGNEFRKFWASAHIRLFRDAVVAVNSLRKGREITVDDIELIRAEQRGSQSVVSSLEEVLGMTAKRPINPGDIIKQSYIMPMNLVKRGDVVTLKIENEKLMIRSMGKAMQNGARGAVISARTLSGKEIFGKVTGPGELQISF
jgi:flagella basal body P-ring formation protein FlgA